MPGRRKFKPRERKQQVAEKDAPNFIPAEDRKRKSESGTGDPGSLQT